MVNSKLQALYELAAESGFTFPTLSSRGSSKSPLSLSVINSSENGKRLHISAGIARAISIEDSVFIAVIPSGNTVIIAPSKIETFAKCGSSFPAKGEKRKVVYSASAVEAITKAFDLDFSDGRTSRSFRDVQIDEYGGVPVALVTIGSPSDEDEDTEEA